MCDQLNIWKTKALEIRAHMDREQSAFERAQKELQTLDAYVKQKQHLCDLVIKTSTQKIKLSEEMITQLLIEMDGLELHGERERLQRREICTILQQETKIPPSA